MIVLFKQIMSNVIWGVAKGVVTPMTSNLFLHLNSLNFLNSLLVAFGLSVLTFGVFKSCLNRSLLLWWYEIRSVEIKR